MRMLHRAWMAASLAGLAFVVTAHAAEPAAPRYNRVTVFGDLPVEFISVNNRGMIAGSYAQPINEEEAQLRGFVRLGRFMDPVTFDNARYVGVTGVNERGEMVGLLDRVGSPEIAFVYSSGKLQPVSIANSTKLPTPRGINNHGDVVGWVETLNDRFGFLISGGQTTLIDAPQSGPNSTSAFGVNDTRAVVGCYEPAGTLFESHGFLWRNGSLTVLRVPNAPATCALDINNRGTIVGIYSDTAHEQHGFVLRDGRYTTIDIPDGTQTEVHSINDSGDIVGFYLVRFSRRVAFKSNIAEFIGRD